MPPRSPSPICPAWSGSTSGTATGRRSTRTRSTASPTPPATTSGSTSTPSGPRPGPFGTTIGHGYLTLSLVPIFVFQILKVDGAKLVVNYGLNKARFPAPVPSGSRVRMGGEIAAVEEVSGGAPGHARPAPSRSRASRSRPVWPRSCFGTTSSGSLTGRKHGMGDTALVTGSAGPGRRRGGRPGGGRLHGDAGAGARRRGRRLRRHRPRHAWPATCSCRRRRRSTPRA